MSATPEIEADPQVVAARLRIELLATQIARELWPRLWQAQARAEGEIVVRRVLVAAHNRGVLRP